VNWVIEKWKAVSTGTKKKMKSVHADAPKAQRVGRTSETPDEASGGPKTGGKSTNPDKLVGHKGPQTKATTRCACTPHSHCWYPDPKGRFTVWPDGQEKFVPLNAEQSSSETWWPAAAFTIATGGASHNDAVQGRLATKGHRQRQQLDVLALLTLTVGTRGPKGRFSVWPDGHEEKFVPLYAEQSSSETWRPEAAFNIATSSASHNATVQAHWEEMPMHTLTYVSAAPQSELLSNFIGGARLPRCIPVPGAIGPRSCPQLHRTVDSSNAMAKTASANTPQHSAVWAKACTPNAAVGDPNRIPNSMQSVGICQPCPL